VGTSLKNKLILGCLRMGMINQKNRSLLNWWICDGCGEEWEEESSNIFYTCQWCGSENFNKSED